MSREFFHILTDPGDGDLEFDTSVNVANLAVDLDGSPSGLSFTQVNDGYYFEFTVSGLYTISISAVDQDEYTDMALVADEDNVTTQMLQSVEDYIYSSGGYLRIYTDGSSKNLHAGDIVDDDTTGGSAVPSSAEIAKTHGEEIDTLNTLIRENLFGGGQSIIGGSRTIFSEIVQATATANNDAGEFIEYENDENAADYDTKIQCPYDRLIGENHLILNAYVKTDKAATIGRLAIAMDTVVIGYIEFGLASGALSWSPITLTINMNEDDILGGGPIEIAHHKIEIQLLCYSYSATGSVFLRNISVIAARNPSSDANLVIRGRGWRV